MTSYWYSTNGMNQRRLSIRHLSILDQAFERHTRIQIFDDEVFGQNVAAIANPYQGTMTAGDLHFGLYRQPPMWRMSDTSLDTLILMESNTSLDQFDVEAINNITSISSNSAAAITASSATTKNRHTNGDNEMNRLSDASLDSNNKKKNLPRGVLVNKTNNDGRNSNSNNNQTMRYSKYLQRRKTISQTPAATEEHCICCRIS